MTRNSNEIVVTYETVGYEPDIDGGPESRHIHFYFNTVPVDQAGLPATGPWVVYDVDDNGEYVYRFPDSEIPDGATELCASAANVNHGLDDHLQDCATLP